MKCPVCGGTMEQQFIASGDLYQSNSSRYVCRQCGHGGASDDDILAEIVKKCQTEEETL